VETDSDGESKIEIKVAWLIKKKRKIERGERRKGQTKKEKKKE
jgi:hypothetical protein